MAVEGDLRFASHRDTLRAVERAARRAALPLRYSRGFNPRAAVSLIPPRPVGVASADDLLVLALDEPMDQTCLLERLSGHAPEGMRFFDARILPGRGTPGCKAVEYRCRLGRDDLGDAGRRLATLQDSQEWIIERTTPAGPRRRKSPARRVVDLRPLVEELRIDENTVIMKLIEHGGMWARPGEVLCLLGLDERIYLASTLRSAVSWAC